MEPLNNEENDSFRPEAILNNKVLFMEDGLLTAAEISPADVFLIARDFVANLTADRILALFTVLLPAGLFIVRKGRDI